MRRVTQGHGDIDGLKMKYIQPGTSSRSSMFKKGTCPLILNGPCGSNYTLIPWPIYRGFLIQWSHYRNAAMELSTYVSPGLLSLFFHEYIFKPLAANSVYYLYIGPRVRSRAKNLSKRRLALHCSHTINTFFGSSLLANLSWALHHL